MGMYLSHATAKRTQSALDGAGAGAGAGVPSFVGTAFFQDGASFPQELERSSAIFSVLGALSVPLCCDTINT